MDSLAGPLKGRIEGSPWKKGTPHNCSRTSTHRNGSQYRSPWRKQRVDQLQLRIPYINRAVFWRKRRVNRSWNLAKVVFLAFLCYPSLSQHEIVFTFQLPSEPFVLSCNKTNPKSCISNLNDRERSLKLANAASPIAEQMCVRFQPAPPSHKAAQACNIPCLRGLGNIFRREPPTLCEELESGKIHNICALMFSPCMCIRVNACHLLLYIGARRLHVRCWKLCGGCLHLYETNIICSLRKNFKFLGLTPSCPPSSGVKTKVPPSRSRGICATYSQSSSQLCVCAMHCLRAAESWLYNSCRQPQQGP